MSLSTECPEGTYGFDCQSCSDKCMNAKCDKFSVEMVCIDGCIAGYRGDDCSQGSL